MIYEQTAVTDVEPGALPHLRPALRTVNGLVRAGAVVLAGEAYLTQLRARSTAACCRSTR